MYSPIERSVVLRKRNRTIIDLLGNVFIHNAARSRLSPQIAKLCKDQIVGIALVLANMLHEQWSLNTIL